MEYQSIYYKFVGFVNVFARGKCQWLRLSRFVRTNYMVSW